MPAEVCDLCRGDLFGQRLRYLAIGARLLEKRDAPHNRQPTEQGMHDRPALKATGRTESAHEASLSLTTLPWDGPGASTPEPSVTSLHHRGASQNPLDRLGLVHLEPEVAIPADRVEPVSYTHLTLPT